ncbi:MAG: hypothetical protein EPO00_13200 [Chloroflexota bacterium]|nr:MAG: hypothetical protein EPO00_13200 [Chloroflexota bacterium]
MTTIPASEHVVDPIGLVAIESDAIRVEILPSMGARLHRLTVFGHDLLRTPDDLEEHRREPFRWGGYVMAPWCNRIDPGATDVRGVLVDLPSNSSDGTALHGQVYLAPWEQRGAGMFAIRAGGGGWPWPYESTLRVSARDGDAGAAVLVIDQVLVNAGDTPMPGGLGIHPWFRGPVEIQIASDRVLPSNLRADDPVEPVAGDFDLRVMRTMPAGLDAAWLDPGRPPVLLLWPDWGVRGRIEVDSNAGLCIVAASPADVGAIAVEPETHAPHGLRRLLAGGSDGLAWIGPGESITLTTTVVFERAG